MDVRDFDQRKGFPVKIKGIHQLTIDGAVNLLKKGQGIPKTNILAFDNVGKQVRWLQYYFNEFGIKNYFFLKGGAMAWKQAGYNNNGIK